MLLKADNLKKPLGELKCMSGTASCVKALAAEGSRAMFEPVLERVAGQVRAELGNEELAEVGMLPVTKQLPDVRVF